MVLGTACVYPTDRTDGLRVVMDEIPELLEGELHRLNGTVVDADGNRVPNAEVAFASSDAQVAVVDISGGMLATGAGETEIEATAVGLADVEPDIRIVRIHNLIEIDSVRPLQVKFGDTLSVYGVGLDPQPFGPGSQFISVVLGSDLRTVEAIPKGYVPEDPERPSRFGRLSVWVPPPTPPFVGTAIFGVHGLATSEADTIRVLQEDLYEPNDTIPADLEVVDGIFRNPALAFEVRPRDDSLRSDWYRVTHPATGDLTILLRSSTVSAETYQAYFTDSLAWDGQEEDFVVGPSSWIIGTNINACRGLPFAPQRFAAESTIVAIRDLPAGTYDFLIGYGAAGAYEIVVRHDYVFTVQPDPFEENDYCDVAKPWVLGTSRFLTIDNPHDVDWFRFTVAGGSVNAGFDVESEVDGSDLDIYVLRDYTPDSLVLAGVSQIGGETDEVTLTLAPGDYFLVAVDYAGVATPYRLSSTVSPASPGEMPEPVPNLPHPDLRLPLRIGW